MTKQSALYAWLFAAGGMIYSTMEILWRGYTHWSMTLCGGFCLCLMTAVGIKLSDKNWLMKSLIGCGVITCVEFLTGCIVNLIFHLNVWDYSNRFGNLFGQICLQYCALWFAVSAIFFGLIEMLESLKTKVWRKKIT